MTPKKPPEEVLEYIRQYFEYDSVTGNLYRFSKKYQEFRSCIAVHDSNRFRVKVKYKTYYVSNICWFIFYKEWPSNEIDHEDLDGFNNKIINLRLSGFSKNSRNADKRNTNVYHGVSYHRSGKKWRYRFSIDEKRYEKYGFLSAKDAALARENHLDNLKDIFCARNKNLE